MHRILPALLLIAAAALAAPRGAPRAAEDPPAGPSLLVPAVPDSAIVEPEPAPLLVPGRVNLADTSGSPRLRARQFLELARYWEENGQALSAVNAYRTALRYDSSHAGVARRIGELLVGLGRDADAVDAFLLELRRHPGDAGALRELGLALARLGEHDEARRHLALLVARAPRDDEAWAALGSAHLAAGRADDARRAFEEALALPPERAAEHVGLGLALARLGRAGEARERLRRAARLAPRDAAPWLNLGNLEREANRLDAALAAYREAARRDTALAEAAQGEARTLAAMKRMREAGAAYRRWVALAPLDLGARLESVTHFIAEGRPDAALEIARDALRRDETSPDAHLLHGVALEATGRTREALAALRAAEARFRTDAGRQRARQLIAALRAGAPDSLRPLFEADSLKHAGGR